MTLLWQFLLYGLFIHSFPWMFLCLFTIIYLLICNYFVYCIVYCIVLSQYSICISCSCSDVSLSLKFCIVPGFLLRPTVSTIFLRTLILCLCFSIFISSYRSVFSSLRCFSLSHCYSLLSPFFVLVRVVTFDWSLSETYRVLSCTIAYCNVVVFVAVGTAGNTGITDQVMSSSGWLSING